MARFIILLFSIFTSSIFAGQRGLWVVRNSLTTQNDFEILQRINRRLQLTDLYFQVRALGKNVIPKHSARQTVDLRDIIRFCKQNNIRLHAWINAFYVWNSDSAPEDNFHSVNRDPEHLLVDPALKSHTLESLKKTGAEGYFVDPEANENLNQMKQIIRKLILDYGIRGIHFDYFRFPPPPVHYSVFLRTKFLHNYFIDPAKMELNFKGYCDVFGGESYQFMRRQYQIFLQNELSQRLIALTMFIKELNPEALVSVAVKPDAHTAESYYMQNWPDWLNKDACDYVVMMNYSPNKKEFKKNLKMAKSIKWHNRIVAGIGIYYLDAMQISERIQEVNQMNYNGYCLFSFTTFINRPDLIRKISSSSL